MDLQDSRARAGPGTHRIIEIVNGSHCLTINGYSLVTKGMGVGNHISSESFTVGGSEWAIYFYPQGKHVKDFAHSVSAYIVALTSEGEEVRALFELTLLDQRTNSLLDQSTNTENRIMRYLRRPRVCATPMALKHGEMWGADQLCPRAYLETLGFLKNDTLSISCKVGVVVSRTPRQKLCSISVPEPDLGEHLGALLDSVEGDSTFGDVTFEVDGEVFQAHKMVLAARSPVFKSQFYGPMHSGSSNKIHLKDIVAPVFKAMLHFIYRDVLPDISQVETTGSSSSSSTLMIQHLFVAADRYGLNRLRLLCESKLCENMSTDTAATTLTLAEQHHASELKAHCLKYAAANLSAVIQSDSFKHLKNSCPSLETELLRTVAGLSLESKPLRTV